MGLGRIVPNKPRKTITAKDIKTANRVLKKGRKIPKRAANYSYTRGEFVAPPKGKKKIKEEEKDLNLVYDYGTKAQKAKSFGTVKKKHGGQIFDGNKFVMSLYKLMK